MNDSLKLSPQIGNNEIIAKIKMDASQPANFFGSPNSTHKKSNKRSTKGKMLQSFAK